MIQKLGFKELLFLILRMSQIESNRFDEQCRSSIEFNDEDFFQ